jgi:hypothetical protein
MSRRLTENLTSTYIGAAHSLFPKTHRQRTVVYVESYDDVAFWRNILAEYEDDSHCFEVMLPSQTTLAKGKKTVLMNSLDTHQLGKNLIACVDSDYDFLLQGATKTSDALNANRYIFQTYAYAIENYQCYAEGLHDVCVQATLNDREIIDFVAFLEEYSTIIYPLFLWSIWFYRHNDTHTFPMYTFNDSTRIFGEVNINNPDASLVEVSHHVDASLHRYRNHYPTLQPEIDKMGEELKKLGLEPKTTYLYIQGHHLMNDVVVKLLDPVCTQLRKEREDEIKKLAEHDEQYHNELTCYDNSQVSIEVVLRKGVFYQPLFLYQWLRDDLADFMDEVRGIKRQNQNQAPQTN